MKLLTFLIVILLVGCSNAKHERLNGCMTGVVVAIKTLKEYGMQIDAGADSDEITSKLVKGCETATQ